jgi:hypothetical protein
VLAALVRLLVATPPADMAANWPSAAEAAVSALYALSPQPQELLAAVLQAMFVRCKPGALMNAADLDTMQDNTSLAVRFALTLLLLLALFLWGSAVSKAVSCCLLVCRWQRQC